MGRTGSIFCNGAARLRRVHADHRRRGPDDERHGFTGSRCSDGTYRTLKSSPGPAKVLVVGHAHDFEPRLRSVFVGADALADCVPSRSEEPARHSLAEDRHLAWICPRRARRNCDPRRAECPSSESSVVRRGERTPHLPDRPCPLERPPARPITPANCRPSNGDELRNEPDPSRGTSLRSDGVAIDGVDAWRLVSEHARIQSHRQHPVGVEARTEGVARVLEAPEEEAAGDLHDH